MRRHVKELRRRLHREVGDGERDLADHGHTAAPTPNGFGRRLYCQQEIAMTE
jgi:hypothetical protein